MAEITPKLSVSIPVFHLQYSGSKRKVRDETVYEYKEANNQAPLYIVYPSNSFTNNNHSQSNDNSKASVMKDLVEPKHR